MLGHKKPININNCSGLSREWVGVRFVYVLPFSWAKRKTQKQNSQEISGKCRDNPGKIILYAFACSLGFSGPENGHFGMIFLCGWEWPMLICWARRNYYQCHRYDHQLNSPRICPGRWPIKNYQNEFPQNFSLVICNPGVDRRTVMNNQMNSPGISLGNCPAPNCRK